MRLEIRPRHKKQKAKLRKLLLLVFTMLLFVCVVFIMWGKTSDMLREVAKSEIESIAYDIVGNVVEKELTQGGDYRNIITIEKDSSGRVSSISSDTQKLNLLKLRISNELSDIMLKRTDDNIYIPLGSLTGIDFLTGRGPMLEFRIYWVSGVDSNFSTSFTSAGINQTNYKIMLDFSIESGMMLSGHEVGVDVGTSICVAETVIVGEIPKILYNK